MQVYQQFDIDSVPPVCNFIINETPTQVVFCEFWEFLLKTRLWHMCFLGNFANFPSFNFIENKTVFSCKLWQIVQPVTLLKVILHNKHFLVDFEIFFSPVTLLKARLHQKCFLANSEKFLKILYLYTI